MNVLLAAALLLPQAPPDDDAAAARAAVEAVVAAMNNHDIAAFAKLFDVKRLVEELRARTGAPLDGVDGVVRLALGGSVAQARAVGQTWGEIRSFRLKRAGDEAEAACVLKSDEGLRERLRFWLLKRPEGWRVFDFESVSDGLRMSLVLSAFLGQVAEPEKAPAARKAAQGFRNGLAAMAQGEAETALTALQGVDRGALPAAVGPFVDTMEGVLLWQLGRLDEALERLERSLTAKPDVPRALRVKSEICLELERWADAAKAEEAYLELIPDDPDAFLNLGTALRELGRAEAAEAAFRKGAACDGEDVENRLQLGLLLASQGRAEEAKVPLLEALTRSEDAESDYSRAAEAILEGPSTALLLALAEEESKARPDAVEPLYHQAHALRRLGRFEDAEKALGRAEALDADGDWEIELREERACVLAHLGKREEAKDLAGRLSAEGEKPAGLFAEAYLHAAAGEEAEAARALGDALREDPDLHAKFAREKVFDALREKSPAKDLLAAAKAKSDYVSRSLEYYWRDRHDALRALAEARVAAAPDDTDAWHDLGVALRRLGRHDAAEKALRTGLAKETAEGDRPRFWDELGQALARSGRPREALEWAARLLAEEDWQAEGHALAAAAHAFLDDRPAALASLSKLFEEDPDALDLVEEDAAFQELRGDPGYATLTARVRRKRQSEE